MEPVFLLFRTPADGSPGHRRAVARLPPRCKSSNYSGEHAVKMYGRITQGKRDEADKERPDRATVRGDTHRGGSVYGRKKRVGAKIVGLVTAAEKIGCNSRKAQ